MRSIKQAAMDQEKLWPTTDDCDMAFIVVGSARRGERFVTVRVLSVGRSSLDREAGAIIGKALAAVAKDASIVTLSRLAAMVDDPEDQEIIKL